MSREHTNLPVEIKENSFDFHWDNKKVKVRKIPKEFISLIEK